MSRTVPFYQQISGSDNILPPEITISGLFMVASLELVIKHGDNTGIALRLHSYPADAHREGYWAPPNLQYPISGNTEAAPQEPDEVHKRFDNYVMKHRESIHEDMKLLAESFGLRGAVVESLPVSPIIEVKPSINEPRVINAFCTIRFGLIDLQEKSEANLVDRESRHGFVVLPLDEPSLSSMAHVRSRSGEQSQRYFLGKPIISSLQNVLDRSISDMRNRAIDVTSVETRRSQSGILIVADIAGYGRVLRATLTTISTSSETERQAFQSRILDALETALTATGTTQVQTAGDGYIAGYPVGDNDLTSGIFLDVLYNWTTTVQTIEDINRRLVSNGLALTLGSRIAFSYGGYQWGRINGIRSFSPAFNGSAVVDAVRLEQGMNSYFDSAGAENSASQQKHRLAIAAELENKLDASVWDELCAIGWLQRGRVTLRAKERDIPSVPIFEWYPASASFETNA